MSINSFEPTRNNGNTLFLLHSRAAQLNVQGIASSTDK